MLVRSSSRMSCEARDVEDAELRATRGTRRAPTQPALGGPLGEQLALREPARHAARAPHRAAEAAPAVLAVALSARRDADSVALRAAECRAGREHC